MISDCLLIQVVVVSTEITAKSEAVCRKTPKPQSMAV